MRKVRLTKAWCIAVAACAAAFGVSSAFADIDYSSIPQTGYWDFGDNPNWYPRTYRTTLADDGPRHADGTMEWLGQVPPDYETDGQPDLLSLADDGTGPVNDEGGISLFEYDGVTFLGSFLDPLATDPIFPNRYVAGYYGRVEVTVSVSGYDSGRYGPNDLLYVDGWLDWKHDGDYDDSGVIDPGYHNEGEPWSEHIVSFTTDPSTWDDNSMTFTLDFVNGLGEDGDMYGRFRVNYDEGVNLSYGLKMTGEVEDYLPDKDQARVPVPAAVYLGLIGFGATGVGAAIRRRFGLGRR